MPFQPRHMRPTSPALDPQQLFDQIMRNAPAPQRKKKGGGLLGGLIGGLAGAFGTMVAGPVGGMVAKTLTGGGGGVGGMIGSAIGGQMAPQRGKNTQAGVQKPRPQTQRIEPIKVTPEQTQSAVPGAKLKFGEPNQGGPQQCGPGTGFR